MSEAKTSQKCALVVGQFGFVVGRSKLVVYRRDRARELPHLTLGWYRHGLVDIHLTHHHEAEMAGEDTKVYEPIGETTVEKIGQFGEELAVFADDRSRTLTLKLRPVRPGWLHRAGYIVFLVGKEDIQPFLNAIVPKSRGKYRLDPEPLDEPERLLGDIERLHFSPRVLHVVGPQSCEWPITASRPGRKRAKDELFLFDLGDRPGGRWWSLPQIEMRQFALDLLRDMARVLAPRLRPENVTGFERIVAALELHEVPDVQPLVNAVRSFLRDPELALREAVARR